MADSFGWGRQRNMGPVGSSNGPALAEYGGRLFAAWKGIAGDQGLYWSSSDGRSWAPQQHIDGVGSSIGPSLASFQNRLYAAWKGIDNDQGIYWSAFDGTAWAPQQLIGGVGSSVGPSLAVFGGRLYAIWKGVDKDQGIYWSSFDGHAWAPQQRIGGVGTSFRPALTVFNSRLFAAWKGVDNDQGIYWSAFDGAGWAPQRNVGGSGSSNGPALATFGGGVYASWKGVNGDQGIWWSLIFDVTTFNRSIGLTMQQQLQSNWCWSAVSCSVSHYYDAASTWTQCTLVNNQLGQNSCCQNGSSAACNKPWYLEKALGATGKLESWATGQADLTTVEGDIVRKLPIGVRIGWAGGGGHFIVIDGARSTGSMVHVEDPIYGSSDITYATLQAHYQGSGSWTHTYYTKP